MWHGSCAISQSRSRVRGGNVPVTTLLPQLVIPGLFITPRTSANLIDSRPPHYISYPLFIATTLIWSLTISLYSHRVTRRDAGGFKWASLQHPNIQVASTNRCRRTTCDWWTIKHQHRVIGSPARRIQRRSRWQELAKTYRLVVCLLIPALMTHKMGRLTPLTKYQCLIFWVHSNPSSDCQDTLSKTTNIKLINK